jgi:hypothetical protein
MYQFNDQGKLRDFAKKQETFLTNIMMRRGLLSIDDTIYKSQPIYISGPAKSLLRLRVQDSTAVDTLSVKDEFEF